MPWQVDLLTLAIRGLAFELFEMELCTLMADLPGPGFPQQYPPARAVPSIAGAVRIGLDWPRLECEDYE